MGCSCDAPTCSFVLSDGTLFEGYAAGHLPASGVTTGEFVFNTALSGYQEVITDPSYAGQIVAFTYPHIGNYGVTPLDDEALRPWCEGIVVRELSDVPSSWRSVGPLEGFLRQHGVPAMWASTRVDSRDTCARRARSLARSVTARSRISRALRALRSAPTIATW